MVLSNTNIEPVLQSENHLRYLSIDPLIPNSVQPASIDLHLDEKILVEFNNKPQLIIPNITTPNYDHINISHIPYIIEPGNFILGSTIETVNLNHTIAGIIAAKSSLARIGLTVTPGFIDPGFNGTITLEIFNVSKNRIQLNHKMGIAQLITYVLADPATRVYGDKDLGSKYQNQQGVTTTRNKNNDN